MKAKQLLLTLFAVIFLSTPSRAEVYSGTCGDNVTWTLNTTTGLLKIAGTGAMYDSSFDNCGELISPWGDYRESITSVEIADGITSIGDFAFYYCLQLTSAMMPNSVTNIGNGAFCECMRLTSATIPNSVTSIGYSAFRGCASLPSVTIPNSITQIEEGAFLGCDSFTSIEIPNSVTSIGESSFSGCSRLLSVTIPNSVTSIGGYAFRRCSSLTSITIPNSVTSIGDKAFNKCSNLTSITIGSSVNSIGNETFASCENLADVYCYAEKVPRTKTDAFDDSYVYDATLHVPNNALNDYKRAIPWKDFGTITDLGKDPESGPVCATPTIAYADGKLTFSSATEGAEFIYTITDNDVVTEERTNGSVSLNAALNISVYAVATEHTHSETAKATLYWLSGSLNGSDGVEHINAERRPVIVSVSNGTIMLKGLNEGERVDFYAIDGTSLGHTTARGEVATFQAPLTNIVVAKVCNQSLKIMTK